MHYHGVGHCDESSGYYMGWDGLGEESEGDCKQLCMMESKCTFAAYFNDGDSKSCSRYEGETCPLIASDDHTRAHTTFSKKGSF